jgi:hypothetical protein
MLVNESEIMRNTGKYIRARRTVAFGRIFGHSGERSRSRRRKNVRAEGFDCCFACRNCLETVSVGGDYTSREISGCSGMVVENESLADTACPRLMWHSGHEAHLILI